VGQSALATKYDGEAQSDVLRLPPKAYENESAERPHERPPERKFCALKH
jgi:hypothetical protein